MLLRFEKKEDIKGIHSVHVESFETDQEAKLVDDLRLGGLDLISLVAEKNQKIIGHLLFTDVTHSVISADVSRLVVLLLSTV